METSKNQKSTNPYLDKALDVYRSAVKAWGRNILIAMFVFVVTGFLVVLPLVQWSDKKQMLGAEIEQNISERQRIEATIDQITGIQREFASEKQMIAEYGQDLARQLSARLSGFARAIDASKEDQIIPQEPFPGASMAEQFVTPYEVGPHVLDPKTVIEKDYGLSREDILLITTAVQDSPDWNKAAEIVRNVYHREINHIYEKLDKRVGEGVERLKACTEAAWNSIGPAMRKFGVYLPGVNEVMPEVKTISRPSDDRLFQTRGGKREAMRVETQAIAVNLDAAIEPLEMSHEALISSAERLDQSIAELQAQQREVQKNIRGLENEIKTAAKHLARVSVPLEWLPVDIQMQTLVRVYPTLIAIVFVFLARKFSRLSHLHDRLYEEYKNQGMADKDIDLVLYVPDAAFDWFGGLGSALSASVQGPRLVASVLVLGLLGTTIWIIESSPSFSTRFSLFLHLPALALSLLGCYYFLLSLLKRVPRQR